MVQGCYRKVLVEVLAQRKQGTKLMGRRIDFEIIEVENCNISEDVDLYVATEDVGIAARPMQRLINFGPISTRV